VGESPVVGEADAVLRSLPPDQGLYVPERMPSLERALHADLANLELVDFGRAIANAFFDDSLDEQSAGELARGAWTFDAPLVPVTDRISVLELFHGPTLAFKDFGARFMARLMPRLRVDDRPLTVLVATSGDTGAAVASGFAGVEGTRVVVLFPRGRVSANQELQLTTFGGNVLAIEVDGTFDDCQTLVKGAFANPRLNDELALASANSINVARLVPQSVYYLRGWQQRPRADRPTAFCVPSGNLGNLTAGLWARALGLRGARFIAATNVNDAFVQYLQGNAGLDAATSPAQRTLSNAMDVATPSNLLRIDDLFDHDLEAARRVVTAHRVDDAETLSTMGRVHQNHGYLLDPHTAVGWRAAELHLEAHPEDDVVVLATAHPAKFPQTVRRATGSDVPDPPALAALRDRPRRAEAMTVDASALASRLLAL